MLLDEAYAEFAGTTFIPDLAAFPNVVVGRTFSKAYGLAGLRIGCLIGSPDTLDRLRPAVPVYSVNIAAVVAVEAALKDPDHVNAYLREVAESKRLLYAACDRLGLKYWKSDANFVLVAAGDRVPVAHRRRRGARHLPARPVHRAGLRGLPAHHDGPRPPHATMHSGDRGGLVRRGVIKRRTTETAIALTLVLEGKGRYQVRTGIRFLDHMLELVARHGAFDLRIDAPGDLDVDQHHTVEDLGIALGEAVSKALGNRRGINRAGYFVMPMDETLAVAAVDLGGRPHAVVDLQVKAARVGDLQTELVHDFFEGFAIGARANVHVKVLYGRSSHHKIEAVFKAFARALRVACAKDRRLARMLPSTKGLL